MSQVPAGMSKVFILDKYFNELQKFWDTEKRLKGKQSQIFLSLTLVWDSSEARIEWLFFRAKRSTCTHSNLQSWLNFGHLKIFLVMRKDSMISREMYDSTLLLLLIRLLNPELIKEQWKAFLKGPP